MRTSVAFLSAICLGTVTATTIPSRLLSRRAYQRHSNPPILEDLTSFEQWSEKIPSSGQVTYSSNWAGAVISGGSNKFVSVTGNVIIGPATAPTGGRNGVEYATTTWVGIGGISCATNALLQTGVDSYVDNGVTRYEAWYEWYPLYSTRFPNFAVKLGDEIRMNVTAYSATSGIAILDNLTTKKSVNHTFSTGVAKLCFESAEWIVEDFSSGSQMVNFANFTTVTFTNTSAIKQDNTKSGAGDAKIFAIKQQNKVYTDCSVPSDSSVTCKYAL